MVRHSTLLEKLAKLVVTPTPLHSVYQGKTLILKDITASARHWTGLIQMTSSAALQPASQIRSR